MKILIKFLLFVEMIGKCVVLVCFFLLIILNCYIGVSIIVSNYIILLNLFSIGKYIKYNLVYLLR